MLVSTTLRSEPGRQRSAFGGSTIALRFFLFLALFLSLSPAVFAQDIGSVGFRTVLSHVFAGQTTPIVSPSQSTLPCPSNGNPCNIPNLGQNSHSIVYTVSNTCGTGYFMDLRLEATNDGTTWFAISSDATDQNSGAVQGSTAAGLTATGLYAGLRLNLVSIACLGGGSTPAITANYSGTFTSTPGAFDLNYQSNIFRKLIVQNQPTTGATTQPAVTIAANNANTGGGIYISCFIAANGATTGCPSGMSVSLTSFIAFGSSVGGGGGGNVASSQNTFTVPATVTPIIQVPNVPAISMTFTFGGAGTAGVNWSIYYIATSTPTSTFSSDPCLSSGTPKSSAPISIAAAGTSQIVALSLGQKIYPCGLMLEANASGSSIQNYQWEYGTGASCGTGTTILSGPMQQNSTNGNNAYGFVGATWMNIPISNALCVVVSQIAGAVINVNGVLSYVQQ